MKTIPKRIGAFLILFCLAMPALAAIRYVALNSANPTLPYTNWSTAAASIQDAVNVSSFLGGDTVLVTNGVYQTGATWATLDGGYPSSGMSNRVAVNRPVRVESVNGPAVTMIVGYQVPGTTNGDTAIRCVFLASGAALVGFTLTNGATQNWASQDSGSGGGVCCVSASAVVSNCVMIGNSAGWQGGGSFRGTLKNCILQDNSVWNRGGGAYAGTLTDCVLTGNRAGDFGGGAAGDLSNVCTLNRCTLTGNRVGSGGAGGGAFDATLNNCTIAGNSASWGGGAYWGTLNNCTVTGNHVNGRGGGAAGESYRLTRLNNCIVYFNTAAVSADDHDDYCTMNYSCTTPMPTNGVGNITNAPAFVDQAGGNLHLQSNSACINTGNNAYAPGSIDLGGNARIKGVRVDIGAYEFNGIGLSDFTGWLWEFGLRTDGSSDYVDSDSDLMNNRQEWIAGTNPTNASSVLRMLNPMNDVSGVLVSWQSVSNRTYFLERATNLGIAPSFSLLTSNMIGHAGTTSHTDTNAVGPGPYFYRVGLQ